MGVLWYDDEARTVERVGPWEFYFDPGEFAAGKLTRCMLEKQQFPLIALESVLKKDKESSYMQAMENTPNAICTYKIYYDLMNKMRYKYIGSTLIEEAKIEYDQPPFVWIYYNDPVKGVFSDSMIDVVYRIQKMIDDITYKITAAIELSPANTTYVPKGSDIKTSVLASSKTGDIFEYNLPSTGGSPVIVATPPVMDGQWIQLLELFEQKAYNLLGVSQLSAQAKKPSGLNSGVALQTMEDVESERHNVLVNNFIHFQKDIAERMIDIFPDDEDILPRRSGRSNIKWRDVRKERDLFNIQTSSGSSLSKDPKVKMEQIEKLISMKIIAPELASTLLEFPDLEGAYSISTASYDCNEKIIERALEDGPDKETGQYHFYEVTNIQQLYAQTVNMLLRLDANDEKTETLENLVGLLNQVKGMIDEIQAAVAPPPPEMPAPGPPPMPPPPGMPPA
jgi:hypothetical protein